HPAGVVAKCGCGQRHVKQQRIVDRHPVVERFELRELVGPLLEHVTDLPQDLRPFRRRQLTPRAAIEGPAGGGNGAVDVLGTALSYASQDLASGGGGGPKRSPAAGLPPPPPPEE